MLERMERIAVEREGRRVRFSFPAPPRSGRRVASLRGVRKAYGDNVVYASVDLEVERGERVALVGPNGAGKSTLLRLLAGVLPLDGGGRMLGVHVDVHYYAQHQLDALTPDHTVLEELTAAAPELGHTRLRTILGAFLFSGDGVDKRVRVLSGGEKARLALARMLVRPAALLCLDEPTNHLDLASREVLEDALAEFPGTIVFISHDRYFINRMATRIVDIHGGCLTSHLGDYDAYLAATEAAGAALGATGVLGLGTTWGRRRALGAKTPKKRTRLTLGGGISAARRRKKSMGVRTNTGSPEEEGRFIR
jgi:ATP-binding cassette subfamily F protein 3